MCLEVTICCADVFALVAAERLFSSMTTDMDFQISRTCECGFTHVATMGFLPPSVLNSLGRRRHRTKLASPPWGEGLFVCLFDVACLFCYQGLLL